MTLEQDLQGTPVEEAPGLLTFRTPDLVPFREFIRERRQRSPQQDNPSLPSYAVPVDDDIRRILSRIPFSSRIDDLLEKVIQVQVGPALHNSVRVSPRQFSELYRVVDHCANRLRIAVPRVLVVPELRMNAMTVGTNENHFVLLTSGMVEKCTDAEMRFLVGHECGHIHCNHLTYLALARVLGEWAAQLVPGFTPLLIGPVRSLLQVPLASWQRRAELTCDRAGLLCCGDLQASLRALAKQVMQTPDLADKLDLDEYLAQLDESSDESTLTKLPEYMLAFPFTPKRMAALTLFARSELFYDLAGREKPSDLLIREELERQTDRVTSIL